MCNPGSRRYNVTTTTLLIKCGALRQRILCSVTARPTLHAFCGGFRFYTTQVFSKTAMIGQHLCQPVWKISRPSNHPLVLMGCDCPICRRLALLLSSFCFHFLYALISAYRRHRSTSAFVQIIPSLRVVYTCRKILASVLAMRLKSTMPANKSTTSFSAYLCLNSLFVANFLVIFLLVLIFV